jgi:Fructose-bisphosphate aldolase class-II
MALISLRQLLDHAAENGYGLPAFNVNNMEQVQAIMQAAAAVDSPVILQGSAGARSYAGEPFLRHLIRHRNVSADSRLHAPGPRRVAQHLLPLHPVRFFVRDDGRLAGHRRQDPVYL